MRFPYTHYIERGDDEIELTGVYDVTPFIPASGPTYACGGQPAEGGEIELISVRHNGAEFPLTEDEEAALIDKLAEQSGEDMAEEESARADWAYQEHRDRLLMEQWERGK